MVRVEIGYKVNGKWGELAGEGDSIPDACAVAYDNCPDPSLDDADDLVLWALVHNGLNVTETVTKDETDATAALVEFTDFNNTKALAAAVRAFQKAYEAGDTYRDREEKLLSHLEDAYFQRRVRC